MINDSVQSKVVKHKVFCKHQGHLVNQGLTLCNINSKFLGRCEECPDREPDKYETTISWISIRN